MNEGNYDALERMTVAVQAMRRSVGDCVLDVLEGNDAQHLDNQIEREIVVGALTEAISRLPVRCSFCDATYFLSSDYSSSHRCR
jgi:hypothetical protein